MSGSSVDVWVKNILVRSGSCNNIAWHCHDLVVRLRHLFSYIKYSLLVRHLGFVCVLLYIARSGLLQFAPRRHKGPSKTRKFSYRFSRFPHFGCGLRLDSCVIPCSEDSVDGELFLQFTIQHHLFPLLSGGHTSPRCLCTQDWLVLAAHHVHLFYLCAQVKISREIFN